MITFFEAKLLDSYPDRLRYHIRTIIDGKEIYYQQEFTVEMLTHKGVLEHFISEINQKVLKEARKMAVNGY